MIIAFLIILVTSLLTTLSTFHLAFTGDDWLAFYRYVKLLGPSSGQYGWNYLTYFLTPYGAQDIWMGFLHKLYGNDPSYYYITSYILRLIAAFSFYPLIKYLTKSSLASFLAIIFFSVTPVGIDATNWVFNMPSYITIACFNIFLYFFLKSREEQKIQTLLISGLFYYLAYVITPIRMHGSLLLILSLEAFWLLQRRDLKTLKKVAIRVGMILIIFLFIRYSGYSQGPREEVTQRLGLGITTGLSFLQQGRFDFLFYPLVMFGSVVIPDLALSPNQVISSISLLWTAALPSFIIFAIASLFIIYKTHQSKKTNIKFLISLYLLWTAVVVIIHKLNLTTFSNYQYITLLLIGGYTLIFVGYLIRYFFRQDNNSTALFLSVAWSIFSFFFAWWWVPQSIFPTTYRYLIVSAEGMAILLAAIVGLGKSKKQQISIFSLLLILILVHIISTSSYLNQMQQLRSQESYNMIWSQMPYISAVGKSSRPLVFYFEGTPTNGGVIHDVITFGFTYHMAELYNIIEDKNLPVVMDSWEEVVSAVKDGKSFKRQYGVVIDPIPINNVYVFKLDDSGKLTNLTDEARQKLRES